jgi:hypothetical protein
MTHAHHCPDCGDDWECISPQCQECAFYHCPECFEALLSSNCYDTLMWLNSQEGKVYQSDRPIKSRL